MISPGEGDAGARAPAFCHGLDCPVYAVKRKTERYEMRRYEEGAVWAKVTISGAEYDAAISQGFEELFAYIQGANREKEKVPMAAPVRVTITPGQGPT